MAIALRDPSAGLIATVPFARVRLVGHWIFSAQKVCLWHTRNWICNSRSRKHVTRTLEAVIFSAHAQDYMGWGRGGFHICEVRSMTCIQKLFDLFSEFNRSIMLKRL